MATRGRRAIASWFGSVALAVVLVAPGGSPADETQNAATPRGDAATPADRGALSRDACRDRAVTAVQKRYEGIRDLRARFVQKTRAVSIGSRASEPTLSRGVVVVAKPSRMRWSYETPEPSLVVSDGKTLWIYDPGFGEAQRLPADEAAFSGAALQFLLGRGDLQREFSIDLVSCETGAVELELTPKEPASYEKLFIVVEPVTGNVSRTRIDDLVGNSTVVEFSDLQVNLDPSGEVFRFVPPAGVRVIELPTPERD
jgi:outer membrane lipoprotein carrier protein